MSRKDSSPINLVIKYALFFFNFAIFLCSGALTGLMTWVLVLKEKKVSSAFDFFLDPSCVLCLAGSVAFVVSIAGFIGALRDNIEALQIYRWSLSVLFFVEIAFIILIFVVVYVPDATKSLQIYPEDALKQAIVKYREDADTQSFIDNIQQELDCCGTSNNDEGYKDWTLNSYFNCSSGTNTLNFGEYCSVPYSCCIQKEGELQNLLCGRNMQSTEVDDVQRKEAIHTRGCFKAVTAILHDNVLVVGGVIIGILVPQMFIICITKTFVDQIKMQRSKWDPRYQRR